MKIPFFNKRVEIKIEEPPKTTKSGLKEGTPISQSTFQKVEQSFNKIYIDRVEQNKQMFDAKMEKSKQWVDFVINLIRDIPRDNIPEVKIVLDKNFDLESIANTSVYLKITYVHNKDGCNSTSSQQYEIFANEHNQSETSLYRILEDIKLFRKELVKDVK